MAMGKEVINPRHLSLKKKRQVSQLESESTYGTGKLGLQVSLTLVKKSNTKANQTQRLSLFT
jgi:hypothetical protein